MTPDSPAQSVQAAIGLAQVHQGLTIRDRALCQSGTTANLAKRFVGDRGVCQKPFNPGQVEGSPSMSSLVGIGHFINSLLTLLERALCRRKSPARRRASAIKLRFCVTWRH